MLHICLLGNHETHCHIRGYKKSYSKETYLISLLIFKIYLTKKSCFNLLLSHNYNAPQNTTLGNSIFLGEVTGMEFFNFRGP